MIINTDLIYPIGAIYLSVSPINPKTLFGGDWEAISQGRFLLGAGSPEANTANDFGDLQNSGYIFHVNDRGGAYKHTLLTTEIPAHRHQIKTNNDDWNNSAGGGNFGTTHDGANGWANNNWYTENTGGGVAHNNMPPYTVVYMWKRVA